MEPSLLDQIKLAIADVDVDELKRLKDICDKLHRGIEVEGYVADNMPPDGTYEEMKHRIEELETVGKLSGQLMTETVHSTYFRARPQKRLSEFHMDKDAIIKSSHIEASLKGQEILVMPKYDGVSCCIKFERNEKGTFDITKARTRGVDVGLINNSTDMTERIKQILYSSTCPWFPRINALTKQFKSITVRGEIVLVKKLDKPAAAYVAGKVNSKFAEIDKEKVIGFKMFEMTRCNNGTNEYIISQEKANKAFQSIDKSLVFERFVLESDEQMLALFDKWNKELSSPIDGLVYCRPDWKYPSYKEEMGVKYGKFALKPYETKTARFESVDYNIGKDGKLVPIIHFTPIEYNFRKYKQAKTTPSILATMITEKRLSKNSVLDISFPGGIPYVNGAALNKDAEKTVEFPTNCPSCLQKLDISVDKNGKTVIRCLNRTCPAVLNKLLVQLMTNIKAKGIAEKRITSAMYYATADFVSVFHNLDTQLNAEGYIKLRILEAPVSSLFIGLDIYTATTIKKDAVLEPILANKVQDELLTVRRELAKYKDNIIVDAVLELLKEDKPIGFV